MSATKPTTLKPNTRPAGQGSRRVGPFVIAKAVPVSPDSVSVNSEPAIENLIEEINGVVSKPWGPTERSRSVRTTVAIDVARAALARFRDAGWDGTLFMGRFRSKTTIVLHRPGRADSRGGLRASSDTSGVEELRP
jgi:hypothetical protein